MATHEEEIETVVRLRCGFICGEGELLLRGHQADRDCFAAAAGGLGADMIGDALGGPLITCRTSMAMLSGAPPGPGVGRMFTR